MAIKQLVLLSTTEIADGSFRSLVEIEKYLESIKQKQDEMEALLRQYQLQFARVEKAAVDSITIDIKRKDDGKGIVPRAGGGKTMGLEKIVVPKLDSLRKNFSVIDELGDQVEHLDSLYNDVANRYRGVRGANDMLKNIKAMQRGANVKMQAALKFLNTIGEKYVPTEFKKMVEDTIVHIAPSLVFQKNEALTYAYETKDGHMAFTLYVKIYGLEDDEGRTHNEFYIVFTCILKPMTEDKKKVDAFYYVTAMPDFALPGRYLLGKQITDPKRAANTLGIILEMENVSTAIGVRPHNLDPEKIKKGRFSVGSLVSEIKVDPQMLTFELIKSVTRDKANDAAVVLYKEVLTLVNPPKPKADGTTGPARPPRGTKPRVKVFQADGRYHIQFTLNDMARDGQLSINDLDFLQEHFPDLDDSKLRQVVKVINSD